MSAEVFSPAYADHYDEWYASKDYFAEAISVHSAVANHGLGGALKILDVGCGTGRHLAAFAELGHFGTGFDQSPAMVRWARKRLPPDFPVYLDPRDIPLGEQDVVIAWFDVLSYQTDLARASTFLRQLATWVRPGGLVLVDCWHTPGLLRDPPRSTATYRALPGGGTYHRDVSATFQQATSLTTVEYRGRITRSDGEVTTFQERHVMRSFTIAELVQLSVAADLVPSEFLCPPDLVRPSDLQDWRIAALFRRPLVRSSWI